MNFQIELQEITNALLTKNKVRLYLLRLDQIHPELSGNKIFKLKYNIDEMRKQGKNTLLTFGGAFSNHIAACAFAGKYYNFNTIGIIRGENRENHTLKNAKVNGMKLHFVSREEYRDKNTIQYIEKLKNQFGDFYLLPEGGSNSLGVKGSEEIVSHIPINYNYLCCPVGTGTTLAGILNAINDKQTALGFLALKNGNYLSAEIKKYTSNSNYTLIDNYHFGGFAKVNSELLNFDENFKDNTGIALDYVYTAKMIYGLYDLIQKRYFPPFSNIVAIHTGGLQGNAGFEQKTLTN